MRFIKILWQAVRVCITLIGAVLYPPFGVPALVFLYFSRVCIRAGEPINAKRAMERHKVSLLLAIGVISLFLVMISDLIPRKCIGSLNEFAGMLFLTPPLAILFFVFSIVLCSKFPHVSFIEILRQKKQLKYLWLVIALTGFLIIALRVTVKVHHCAIFADRVISYGYPLTLSLIPTGIMILFWLSQTSKRHRDSSGAVFSSARSWIYAAFFVWVALILYGSWFGIHHRIYLGPIIPYLFMYALFPVTLYVFKRYAITHAKVGTRLFKANTPQCMSSAFFASIVVFVGFAVFAIWYNAGSRIRFNEAAAIGSVKDIAAAQTDYNNNSYPHRFLSPLKSLLDDFWWLPGQFDLSDPTRGIRYGYVFYTEVSLPEKNGSIWSWSAAAWPIQYKKTGKRSFYIDETGIIRGMDISGVKGTLFMPEVKK